MSNGWFSNVLGTAGGGGPPGGTFWGIAPTGASVTVPEISIYRVAHGRVAEQWCLVDELGRMQQLGAVLTRPMAS